MERVLIVAADSGEELEVHYMLYRLREAGYAVDVAAPERKTLQLVVHDFEPGWDTYVERPGRRLDPDVQRIAAGGELVEGKDVVDGNMVSATGWTDLAEWSRAFVQVLERATVPA
jgi:putative intracellular protease/amidase